MVVEKSGYFSCFLFLLPMREKITDMSEALLAITEEVRLLRENIDSQHADICWLNRNIDRLKADLRKRDKRIKELEKDLPSMRIWARTPATAIRLPLRKT